MCLRNQHRIHKVWWIWFPMRLPLARLWKLPLLTIWHSSHALGLIRRLEGDRKEEGKLIVDSQTVDYTVDLDRLLFEKSKAWPVCRYQLIISSLPTARRHTWRLITPVLSKSSTLTRSLAKQTLHNRVPKGVLNKVACESNRPQSMQNNATCLKRWYSRGKILSRWLATKFKYWTFQSWTSSIGSHFHFHRSYWAGARSKFLE